MDLYNQFLEVHQPQLVNSGVPEFYWPTLFKKLEDQVFDAGLVFQIAKIDYSETIKDPLDPGFKLFVTAENGLSSKDPNNIFLIDHAWLFDANRAREHLCTVPGLLKRLCNLMCYEKKEEEKEEAIEFVLREMWRYNQSFGLNVGTVETKLHLWYIMDELGSAINHSDEPTFRTVPFLYINNGSYTLLYPTEDVQCDDEVTRDFAENLTNDPDKRRALLLPWVHSDFTKESFAQEQPGPIYFVTACVQDTLPVPVTDIMSPQKRSVNLDTKLKVFAQYDVLRESLTDSLFEIVNELEDADILWLTTHFKDYKLLSEKSPHIFINQFPFENVLTVKDLLAITCRRQTTGKSYDDETLETFPSWLPTTFNLNTELVQFVSYFQNREAKGLDNHWICKPWNLARGLDTHVTNNLFHILRLPSTGPKIAQKYITSPVCFTRPEVGAVKFDIRYVVLLKSIEPLKVYAYTNFFLRFANKPFALDELDDYEQHFTVMNYSDVASLYHLKCASFIAEWEKMYPSDNWKTSVEPKIFKMIREVFGAASSVPPPQGIGANSQSRALYAIDLMLEWKHDEIEPVLLEVNFTPDNKRACDYYPDFYNDIFKLLFLDIENPQIFSAL